MNELISRLILSTRRRNRLINLLDIAKDLRDLQKLLGSLDAAAGKIQLSRNMVNRFLSVEKINTEIYPLIRSRKIDSVSALYYLRRFTNKEQVVVAKYLSEALINSHDVRALGPLRDSYKNLPIEDLIQKLLKSKNQKVSVAFIDKIHPLEEFNYQKKLLNLLPNNEVVTVKDEGLFYRIEFSKKAEKALRQHAEKNKLNFRHYLSNLQK